MNRIDFGNLIDDVWTAVHHLNKTKGSDYSGDEDVLANFKRLATKLELTKEQVLGVYMTKHLDAIDTYIREGNVKSEPIDGRINDAIVYLLLLHAMVIEGHDHDFEPVEE